MQPKQNPILDMTDMQTENYALTPRGLVIHSDIDQDQWSEIGDQLGTAGRCLGFLIGDWINYGETKWGDRYTDAMRITGLDYNTLAMYARVAKAIQFSTRVLNLSFEHHRKVAQLKEPEDQVKWLSAAASPLPNGKPVSARRLQKSILAGKILTDDDVAEAHDPGRNNFSHWLNGLRGWMIEFERDDWFAKADGLMLGVLLEDIERMESILTKAKSLIENHME